MNKRVVASVLAAGLLGGGLVWAADREGNNGIAGWETLNASMAQALGGVDGSDTAVPGENGVKGDSVASGEKSGKEAARNKEEGTGAAADANGGNNGTAINSGIGYGSGGGAETGSGTGAMPAADAGNGGDPVAGGSGAAAGAAAGAAGAAESAGEAGNGSSAGAAGMGGAASPAAGIGNAALADASSTSASGAAASAGQAADGRININTADTAVLMNLPGIGEKKAQAIVDYRSSKGAFRSLADLGKVKGIGPKMLEKLEPLVIF
ncbi:helix-hairpin-helix domain-containing protein [Paenibacillus sp. S150]|uniref:ComEA family DNA-binding protein n=1 Tax=Paenibacillus sp. S150 TaxID=2749826 RepID=UPI001C620701|nr:helix-hairpin-helix domain-containing protein [Paenibacillus sp. S150]MBW4080206.1 helix-hairpin-helix domain-containing protein [Paenibacillus sp. S150]